MPVAHDLREQPQLPGGAGALAGQAGHGQAALGMGALDQGVAQRHDLVGNGFQERGAALQRQVAIGIEGAGGEAHGAVHVLARAQAECRLGDLGVGRGIESALDSSLAADGLAADQHFSGGLHGGRFLFNG